MDPIGARGEAVRCITAEERAELIRAATPDASRQLENVTDDKAPIVDQLATDGRIAWVDSPRGGGWVYSKITSRGLLALACHAAVNAGMV